MEGRLKGTLGWVVSPCSGLGKKTGITVVRPLEDLTSAGGLLARTTASSKSEPYGTFTRSMEGFSRARERISFSSRPWLVSCQTALFFLFFFLEKERMRPLLQNAFLTSTPSGF